MGQFDQLERLAVEIASKSKASPESSYTALLLSRGIEKCAKKFGEEAVELAIASVLEKKPEAAAEAADVLYHFLVLLQASGVSIETVMQELKRREGVSGLAEKSLRKDA